MSVNMEEAVLERNIRRFVLVRTAEPVYLELREGLILIRHQSKYGSNLLAAFWCRVFQHPNNYPAFRFPYRKLYDTKGLWKIVLRLDNVLITIFTKTGTLSIKGNYVLEWFMDRFQGLMDAVDTPVQHPQPIPGESIEDYRQGDERSVDERQAHIRRNPRNMGRALDEAHKLADIDNGLPGINNSHKPGNGLPEVNKAKGQCQRLEASRKQVHTREHMNNLMDQRNRLRSRSGKTVINACIDPGLDPTENTEKDQRHSTTFTNSDQRPCGGIDDNVVRGITRTPQLLTEFGGIDSGDSGLPVSQGSDGPKEPKADHCPEIIQGNGAAEEQTVVSNGNIAQDLDDIFGANFSSDPQTSEDIRREEGRAGDTDDTSQVEGQLTEDQQALGDIKEEDELNGSQTQGIGRRNLLDLYTDENELIDFEQNTDSCQLRGEDQRDIGNVAFDLLQCDEVHDLPDSVNKTTSEPIHIAFANDLIDVEPPPFDQNEHDRSVFGAECSIESELHVNTNEEPISENRNGRGDNCMDLHGNNLFRDCNGNDGSVRQQLMDLNQHLKLQQLDLWYGPSLAAELDQLAVPSVKDGTYVYTLWKSLLQKFMATQNCKLYMASPYMDKTRLLDVCHTFLRNRLTACVDGVYVKRQTESGHLVSDVKWSAIREFPANEQAVLEYKLYSSFQYPFVDFHYRFLAGVTDGQAEVLITSADFHRYHFETDSLHSVTYIKTTDIDFFERFINPLMK